MACCDHSFFVSFCMAGHITRMAFQQHTADRVNVYLDGQFALALPAMEAAGLRIGQYLDDLQIAQLREADALQKAYDRAVHYLSFRPRSREEVRRHLTQAGIDAEVIEAALDRLAVQRYLDDAEFARYWVESRRQGRSSVAPRATPARGRWRSNRGCAGRQRSGG